eukprot:g82871.t1
MQPSDLASRNVTTIARSTVHRVGYIDLASGTVSTLLGPSEGGCKDGNATQARMVYPDDITISPDGVMLFVADKGPGPDPNRIRSILVASTCPSVGFDASLCGNFTFREDATCGLSSLPACDAQRCCGCEPGFRFVSSASTSSCTQCSNGGPIYVCPQRFFRTGSVCGGMGLEDTQICRACGLGQASYACLPGQRMNGSVCLGGINDEDTETCEDCSFGGEMYDCGIGSYRTGVACDGRSLSDAQSCGTCANGGALNVYSCPRLYYRNGSACNGTHDVDTQGCAPCSNTAVDLAYRCPAGTFIAGSECQGSSNKDTQQCTPCVFGGVDYTCPQGYIRTGTPCSGQGIQDTQACGECGNGGKTYICTQGRYKSGQACTGTSVSDTQSCSDFASCAIGQYNSGMRCNGSGTTDTHTCSDCSNGGASYSCGAGYYKAGTACPGTGTVDSQTCTLCSNRDVNFQYICAQGRYNSGQACTGTSVSDTQSCSDCASCAAREYNSGMLCNGSGVADTHVCSKCATRGVDSLYECSRGWRLSGSVCLGLEFIDTQLCIECGNGGNNYSCNPDINEFQTGRVCSGTTFEDTLTCGSALELAAEDSSVDTYLLITAGSMATLALLGYFVNRACFPQAKADILSLFPVTFLDFLSDAFFANSLTAAEDPALHRLLVPTLVFIVLHLLVNVVVTLAFMRSQRIANEKFLAWTKENQAVTTLALALSALNSELLTTLQSRLFHLCTPPEEGCALGQVAGPCDQFAGRPSPDLHPSNRTLCKLCIG